MSSLNILDKIAACPCEFKKIKTALQNRFTTFFLYQCWESKLQYQKVPFILKRKLNK